MKKTVAMLLSFIMVMGTITNVHANRDFTFTLDRNTIKVGYTDIYHENAHEEPSKPKPDIPTNQNIEVTIEAIDYVGDKFVLYMLDNRNNRVDIINVEGYINEKSTTTSFEIPGNFIAGEYDVIIDIEGNTKEQSLTILENVNLSSTLSTTAKANDGEVVENLIDGYYQNWVSNSAPSVDNSQDFIFDYGSSIMKISSMQIYTNFGNTHGVKRAEVLYFDIVDKSWKNIKDTKGNTSIDFQWVLNGSIREPFTINFDKAYETNKIMLRVVESNLGWGNSTVMSEIQTWGYPVGDTYDIKQQETVGKEGINNEVHISVGYKNYTGQISFELVSAKDNTSLSKPIKYDVLMNQGKLDYVFLVPNTIPVGEYKIVTTIKDIKDYSLLYTIVMNDERNFNVITSNIESKTSMWTVNGNIESILDGDILTRWTGKIDSSKNITLSPKDKNNTKTNMIIKSLKIYGEKDIDSVRIQARTNQTDQKIGEIGSFVPSWQSDAKGDYFKIDFATLGLSFEYQLFLSSSKDTVTIYDIEVSGIYLLDNLMNKATVYKNGKIIDHKDFTDNDISTIFECTDSLPTTFEFNFAPYTLTSDMLVYVANYPNGQGINKLELELYDGDSWKKLSAYEMKYKTNGELREVNLLPFPKSNISKIKIVITDANMSWGKFVISELYSLGDLVISTELLAESIKNIKQPILGQTKLELPKLSEEFENDFDILMESSSNEDVIALDGTIHPQKEEQSVNVAFKVINKKNRSIGYTKIFTIIVPRIMNTTHTIITNNIDSNSVIKNTSMGWVQYIEGFECRLHERTEDKFHSDLCTVDATDIKEYWKQMDALYAKGLPTSILYIRMPWSWFEPVEGEYAWNNPDSELSQLVSGAKERDLEIAFRVLINSASMKEQATPEWFFQTNGNLHWVNNAYQVDTPKKDPYLDDEVFLEKFGNFIKAFGKEYNDEKKNVSFVDGMGYGNWGETESNVIFQDNSKRDVTVGRIFDMYNKAFPDVLLGAQYNGIGYQDAIDNYGYMIRRDAFGSGYLSSDQKQGIKEYFTKGVPLYAENCYHHFESMKNNWGSSTIEVNRNETLKKVIEDAFELRANTLDARVLEDCKLWLENDDKHGDNLLQSFANNGGYRLSPLAMQIPKEIKVNEEISIDHVWANNALGFLPNKNSHWNNKYKVAFALLNPKTNEVVYQFNESSNIINPGDWLKENGGYQYTSTFVIPDTVKAGNYKLATAIVNEKLDYTPDINLAINDKEVTSEGWYVMDSLFVSHGKFHINISQSENGNVVADKVVVEKNDNVTLTFNPDKGYEVDTVMINDKEVKVSDNQYIIKGISMDMHIKAKFTKGSIPSIEVEKSNQANLDKDKQLVSSGDGTQWIIFIITLIGVGIILMIQNRKNKSL